MMQVDDKAILHLRLRSEARSVLSIMMYIVAVICPPGQAILRRITLSYLSLLESLSPGSSDTSSLIQV